MYDQSVVEQVAASVQEFISGVGYPGLFVLIFLESTLVPIPSMLVMPFAGFLAAQGTFSLPAVLLVNALGALTGSLFSYWLGLRGGTLLLERYGKYFFIKPADIARTAQFFARYGAWAILIARFMPVIRHIISIPAGVARMRVSTFAVQTVVGASLWGGGLIVVGYVLGSRWREVIAVAKKFDLAVAVTIALLLVAFVARFYLKRRRAAAMAVGEPPT